MKKCTRCKKEKNIVEYNKRTDSADGHASHCRVCSRAYVKSHFLRNGEYYRSKQKIRVKRLFQEHSIIIDKLKSYPCSDCKGIFPLVSMDFDHVRGTKRGNISAMVRWGVTRQKLLEELEKCEVVCANCHRVRTRDREKQRGFVV